MLTITKPSKRRTALVYIIRFILIIVGLSAIVYAGFGALDWYRTTHNPKPVILPEVINFTDNKPDETPPTEACENYQVLASQPRLIELPTLNRQGCVQRVGVDQNNAVAVPTNIHLAGWFTGSVLPGEKGVSLIVGHVLGRFNDAIFVDLKDIKIDDIIRIQFGDKSWKEFKVVSKDSYTIEQTAREQLRQLDGVESQLTLITCGGTWLPKDQTFDHRVVVRAKFQK